MAQYTPPTYGAGILYSRLGLCVNVGIKMSVDEKIKMIQIVTAYLIFGLFMTLPCKNINKKIQVNPQHSPQKIVKKSKQTK